jgi:hypothetical protein
MKKTVFILSAAVLFFLVSAEKSLACSCVANTKPLKTQVKEAFNNSNAIFSGEVIEVSPISEYEAAVRIKVERSWKGGLSNEITLTTAKDSAMCGYYFETGKKYLVYANGKPDALMVSNCSRTTAASDRTDIRYLNRLKGQKPKKGIGI